MRAQVLVFVFSHQCPRRRADIYLHRATFLLPSSSSPPRSHAPPLEAQTAPVLRLVPCVPLPARAGPVRPSHPQQPLVPQSGPAHQAPARSPPQPSLRHHIIHTPHPRHLSLAPVAAELPLQAHSPASPRLVFDPSWLAPGSPIICLRPAPFLPQSGEEGSLPRRQSVAASLVIAVRLGLPACHGAAPVLGPGTVDPCLPFVSYRSPAPVPAVRRPSSALLSTGPLPFLRPSAPDEKCVCSLHFLRPPACLPVRPRKRRHPPSHPKIKTGRSSPIDPRPRKLPKPTPDTQSRLVPKSHQHSTKC